MNKLLLKDFIKYNSPCFVCNSNIELIVNNYDNLTQHNSRLHCHVSSKQTVIPIKIKYSNSLELIIHHKDNRFSTNNIDELLKYFQTNILWLTSQCSNLKCNSVIVSSQIVLNTKFFRLDPLTIQYEHFYLKNSNKISAIVMTDYRNNSTVISLADEFNIILNLSLTAMSLKKYKTKEQFFKKMKTYITFS